MIRKAGQFHNNTPEEVREWVLGAVAIVEELDVPTDLREAAFSAAFAQLASKQVAAETMQASSLMAVPRG